MFQRARVCSFHGLFSFTSKWWAELALANNANAGSEGRAEKI